VAAGVTDVELAVIGTGFGGLGAGAMARRLGIDEFVLLERSGAVGGTWRDNTYPGCACDIPGILYSFSFAPNPDWSRSYPTQPELESYLERVADEFGLRDRIRFGFDVARLEWDDESGRWEFTATDGSLVRARQVISATGPLSRPSTASIPGLENFTGAVFHSAQWRHDVGLAGATVAVVGTGASAVQIVPAIADVAQRLVVFQRTPPWVLERDDRPTPSWRRRLYRRLPALSRLHRWRVYLRQELLVAAFIGPPRLAGRLRDRVRTEVRARIVEAFGAVGSTGVDVETLVPEHEPGCKRLLLSNEWYPTLARSDVEVVPLAVERVTSDGVVSSDGVERRVDAIVLATGFDVESFPAPMEVRGRGGVDLREHWGEGAVSDLGVAVDGFPNLWFLLGPGTGLGHNSVVFMAECQLRFIAEALRWAARHEVDVLEVRREAAESDHDRRRERMTTTVWASGCRSWYRDAEGRFDALWPGSTIEYWWRTRRFHPERYRGSGRTGQIRTPIGR